MSLKEDPKLLEAIVVRPPTEYIPDEYEHSGLSTSVHMFLDPGTEHQKNADLFEATLSKKGYSIGGRNRHCLRSDDFEDVVNEILKETIDGGLILYFSGSSRREGQINVLDDTGIVSKDINDIWKPFILCPALKNKPKIFFFQITCFKVAAFVGTSLQADGEVHHKEAYDTPTEADVLIVYKNSNKSDSQRAFIEQLCDNIDNHSEAEDIISLLTCVDGVEGENRHLQISTLTRKFYFTPSELRGLHLALHENLLISENHIKEVKDLTVKTQKQ